MLLNPGLTIDGSTGQGQGVGLTGLTTVEVLGQGESPLLAPADLQALCGLLRSKYDVKFLDVTAGGIVIGSFLALKYLSLLHFSSFPAFLIVF